MESRTHPGSHKTKPAVAPRPKEYRSILLETRWLTARTFEVRMSRPEGFSFRAGQHIRLRCRGLERDYSVTTGTQDPDLALCIRWVPRGALTPYIAGLGSGSELVFTGPHGHFIFRPSDRPAVFVATGTGIAPFVAMARSGVKEFLLLHGVRESVELYYEDLFRSVATGVVPCLTGCGPEDNPLADGFCGRVTAYVESQLARRTYDFYLCGREEMIRDVTLLVDEAFPGSKVYSEIFFSGSGD
jgi:benzoate/toluate 1,2-dioxygenase reductase component